MFELKDNLAIVRHQGASAVLGRDVPAPLAGEIVVAPEAVSLCGTDHQMLRGIRDDPSPVLGHEGACRVSSVGAGVRGFDVGDRVTVNPTHPGDPSFLLGHNVDGLFQQRVRIAASAVAAGLVVPLGPAPGSAAATLVEPLAITDYALDCLALVDDVECLAVLGDGLVGNLTAVRAAARGNRRVVLAHTSAAGLAWSERTWAGTAVEHVLVDEVRDAVGGERLSALVATHRDRTVEMVDLLAGLPQANLAAVHVTGGLPAQAASRLLPGADLAGVRAANTGGPWPPRRTVWARGTHQLQLTGNRGVTSEAFVQAAKELAEGSELERLITHRVGLHEGVRLMNTMVATRSRVVDGRLVLRLVVTLNQDLLVPDAQVETVQAETVQAETGEA